MTEQEYVFVFLLLEIFLPCFTDKEVLNEGGKINFAQNITFNGHQRHVIQSVLAHCVYQSIFN